MRYLLTTDHFDDQQTIRYSLYCLSIRVIYRLNSFPEFSDSFSFPDQTRCAHEQGAARPEPHVSADSRIYAAPLSFGGPLSTFLRTGQRVHHYLNNVFSLITLVFTSDIYGGAVSSGSTG